MSEPFAPEEAAPLTPEEPVALTIAGSDSGGGAGIQADLKTFSALGCYGVSVLTAVTAQNPEGLLAVQELSPETVGAQLQALGAYFRIGAAKTGMLSSIPLIEAVADAYRTLAATQGPRGLPPLVVDPVMVATSGARLLNADAVAALRKRILCLATLITPNMDEAALLSGISLHTPADLERAARTLYDAHGVAVLVKGGHLPAETLADCLYDGQQLRWLHGLRVQGVCSHGTGCTLSAAIAARLLHGEGLFQAVSQARAYLQGALERALRVGAEPLLNHFYAPVALRAAPGTAYGRETQKKLRTNA